MLRLSSSLNAKRRAIIAIERGRGRETKWTLKRSLVRVAIRKLRFQPNEKRDPLKLVTLGTILLKNSPKFALHPNYLRRPLNTKQGSLKPASKQTQLKLPTIYRMLKENKLKIAKPLNANPIAGKSLSEARTAPIPPISPATEFHR